jgi:hypothetical protein
MLQNNRPFHRDKNSFSSHAVGYIEEQNGTNFIVLGSASEMRSVKLLAGYTRYTP